MSKLFYHVMQDNVGNLLFDVSGTMRLAGEGTLATIYGDEALTIIISNPMTNHPSYGSFKCFLGVGDYDFYMAKAGYSFETLTGVQGSGTMADQNASAVAITGGEALGLARLQAAQVSINTPPDPAYELAVAGDVIQTGGAVRLATLGVNRAPAADVLVHLDVTKNTHYGMAFHTQDNDTGANATMLFTNLANTVIGSITTTGAATAFNTTSDVRLKFDVTALTGALDVVRRLRPITHRWKADDSRGVGFLAHEVAEVVEGVITGEKDAVDEGGNILPQMIDYSKLVPFLVGAVKTLSEQVEALTARLAAAGA